MEDRFSFSLIFCLLCFVCGVEEEKVYLRLQTRDVKGETNTLMMGTEKQVGNRNKKHKVKLTGFHNYIDLEEQ